MCFPQPVHGCPEVDAVNVKAISKVPATKAFYWKNFYSSPATSTILQSIAENCSVIIIKLPWSPTVLMWHADLSANTLQVVAKLKKLWLHG